MRDVGSCSGRPRAGLRVAAADASCAAFRDLGMPGAQMRSAGLDVAAIDSADAFRAAYGCAPPLRVDFARERVAVVTTSHAMNVGMQIVAARGDARRGTIRIASTYGCTGIPPPQMTEVLFVVLPASSSAIDVETCGVPRPPCGPVP